MSVSQLLGVRAAPRSGAAVLGACVLGTCVVLTLAGCGPAARTGAASSADASSGAPASPSSASPTAAEQTGPVAAVSTDARDGLAPALPLTVSVAGGTLQAVTVTSPYGPLTGRLSPGATQWSSTATREPGVSYQLVVNATSSAGVPSTIDRTFTTAAPLDGLTVDVAPWGDQPVGVGQPIVVKLSTPVVGKAYRAAVERALVVTADRPFGPASWTWMSSTELHFRPKTFWPGHAKVSVAVNLLGVRAGDDVWGAGNRTVSFQVGRAFVMQISNATHEMTVTMDGRLVRTIPVSMGRVGYETRSGIKTIMSHEQTVQMTSASYGGKDFYDEIVHYAQRLTWSGEYIHSAPWSVAAQGNTNVSHGCVNVSPDNAIWLFGQTLLGDPVVTTGTDRQMEPGNGTGGDWDIPWATWTQGSALT